MTSMTIVERFQTGMTHESVRWELLEAPLPHPLEEYGVGARLAEGFSHYSSTCLSATRLLSSSQVQAFCVLAMVAILKRMPFSSKGTKKTKTKKLSQLDKQRQWVTQGLKHLKAPSATSLCFSKLLYFC